MNEESGDCVLECLDKCMKEYHDEHALRQPLNDLDYTLAFLCLMDCQEQCEKECGVPPK